MRKISEVVVAVFPLVLIAAPLNAAAVNAAAVKVGAKCTKAGLTLPVGGKKFTCVKSRKKLVWNKGVAINEVLFDPGTAEHFNNDPSSGWNLEAFNSVRSLGLDKNNAHV